MTAGAPNNVIDIEDIRVARNRYEMWEKRNDARVKKMSPGERKKARKTLILSMVEDIVLHQAVMRSTIAAANAQTE